MPQIIVKADGASEERSVMLRERINVADFDSDRFAANLVERLGWAVLDAVEAERDVATDTKRHVDTAGTESAEADADRRVPLPA
jgi:hypothetical protein